MKTLKWGKSKMLISFGVVAILFIFMFFLLHENTFAKVIKIPVATETTVTKNEKASIDTSNINEGYVMVKYTGTGSGKIKLIIQKVGGTSYTYSIVQKNKYEAFPFTEGDGSYKVTVYEGIGGTKYTTANGTTVSVKLTNKLLPFLYANQYAWFEADSPVVSLGNQIVKNETDTMKKVQKVYEYVIQNISYDYAKANSVQSGYVCNIDDTLKSKKGICLDYSAVMAAMLRSQEIPTKLVVGYAGTQYHAWISIYSDKEGWIENVIYFDGKNWTLVDPTTASTNQKADFKPDKTKYTEKYTY